MGCTSAFLLPQIQVSIKAPMEKMIDPKIATRLITSKQNHFHNLKTSKYQNQQEQVKIGKIQWQMKINRSMYAQKSSRGKGIKPSSKNLKKISSRSLWEPTTLI